MKKLRGAIISACNKKRRDSFFPKDLWNFYVLAIYVNQVVHMDFRGF